jgi:hypothetical protein
MGLGWYFRDDAIFLKRWLETFARLGACVNPDGSWRRLSKAEADRLIAQSIGGSEAKPPGFYIVHYAGAGGDAAEAGTSRGPNLKLFATPNQTRLSIAS